MVAATRPQLKERAGAATRLWIGLFDQHRILNNASAISFQALKALVPLALFGIALPGVLGLGRLGRAAEGKRVAAVHA